MTSFDDSKPFLSADADDARSSSPSKNAAAAPAAAPLASPPIVFVLIGIIACCNLVFGFENSIVSGAKDDFAAQFGLSKTSAAYGFLAGAMPIGATVSASVAGYAQDGLGRRVTLMLCCVWYMAAAVGEYFADSFAALAAARVCVGLAVGAFSSTVPMYIAELSPAHLRGTLVTCNQVSICTGILLGYATNKVRRGSAGREVRREARSTHARER